METEQSPEEGWQGDVFRVLKDHGVKYIVYVPDAGHSTALRLAEADSEVQAVVLTTEEEGIGYLAGAWLGGERGALLMQSSGVGNCINTRALQSCARFPLLMVMTWRADRPGRVAQEASSSDPVLDQRLWRAGTAGGARGL